MAARKASDVFVECLEAEGVEYVFGIRGWRCESMDDFTAHLGRALALDEPSVIVVPIDYSLDIALSEELGTETVAT